MQTLQLTSHTGEDGLLKVTVPDELKGQEVEILRVMQPMPPSPAEQTSRWAKIAQRVTNDTRYPDCWSKQMQQDIRDFRDNFSFKLEN